MKFVVGIADEQDAVASRVFLESAQPSTEVLAVAIIPRLNSLGSVLELGRGHSHQHVQKLRELEQGQAAELLEYFKSRTERPGLTVRTSVLSGDPAEDLLKTAHRERADFLLVTQWQGSGKNPNHVGHVAGRVARYANCSVVLLDPASPAPQTFLLATDGSPQAKRAADRLRHLPVTGNPTLLVCTVAAAFNPAFVKTGSLYYREYQRLLSGIRDQEEAAARQVLDAAAADLQDTPFRVRKLAYTGDTAEVILRAIREFKVDFLAMGAKGMSAGTRFLVGSVAVKLLNRAPCSILVAR